MNYDDVVTTLKYRLGRKNGPADLDGIILTEMKFVQSTLEDMPEPYWFLLSEVANIETEVGEQRIPLPASPNPEFLMEYEQGALFLYDADGERVWTPLLKNEFEILQAEIDLQTAGPPSHYALVGDYFRIYPASDVAYTLKMLYYGRDDVVAVGQENKWLKNAADLMMAMTGEIIASRYLNDQVRTQTFQRDIQIALDRLQKKHLARIQVNREYQIEE